MFYIFNKFQQYCTLCTDVKLVLKFFLHTRITSLHHDTVLTESHYSNLILKKYNILNSDSVSKSVTLGITK